MNGFDVLFCFVSFCRIVFQGLREIRVPWLSPGLKLVPPSSHSQKKLHHVAHENRPNKMSNTASETTQPPIVIEAPDSNRQIDVLSFGVTLPPNIVQFFDESDKETKRLVDWEGLGMVGTIICTKTSAMIWIGWGQVEPKTESAASLSSIGSAGTLENWIDNANPFCWLPMAYKNFMLLFLR